MRVLKGNGGGEDHPTLISMDIIAKCCNEKNADTRSAKTISLSEFCKFIAFKTPSCGILLLERKNRDSFIACHISGPNM